MPCGQHEPKMRRRAHQQQLKLTHLGGPQLVQVIDHQPDLLLKRGQVRQQPFGDRPAVEIGRRRHRPHQLRTSDGIPQRMGYRDPELLRITLLALRRHPRDVVLQAGRRRSTTVAGPSSRSRPTPTSGSRAPPRPAVRTARGGRQSLRGQPRPERTGRRRSGIGRQVSWRSLPDRQIHYVLPTIVFLSVHVVLASPQLAYRLAGMREAGQLDRQQDRAVDGYATARRQSWTAAERRT